MKCDAVVIGAGINGLVAAVDLASKGWKVIVVERDQSPGGAVKTAEATLPGFRHDLYAMNLSMFAGSAFLAAHREALTQHGLEFVGVADTFASIFSNHKWLGVSTDLAKTTARIAQFSAEDAAAWRTMSEAFGEDVAYIGALMGAPMPSFEVVRILLKAWRKKGLAWVRDMVRLLASSPRAFLDPRFASDEVRALMAAWGMHLDFGPDIAGGAVFPYLESMSCQNFGMVIGKGGADTVITAMCSYFKALGGQILLGQDVVQVIEANGIATGVALADGRIVVAERAVIANVHPKVLTSRLLVSKPERQEFTAAIDGFRPGPGTMMVHLALDTLPQWAAGAELQRFAYVHLAPSYEMMSRAYQQVLSGLLPQEPVLVVGQPTALDPNRAPTGKHILWVQVRAVPYDILGDAAGGIAERDWANAKHHYAERVIDIIEGYAPGLRESVLGMSIMSPRDLEMANPNLVQGDSLSGSHHLDQNFLFRPAGGWSRYRTPVRQLYMVGASTWPGAGTGGGSGFLLAQMLGGKRPRRS